MFDRRYNEELRIDQKVVMYLPSTKPRLVVNICWSGLTLGLLLISGCGQKGDLFIPEQSQQPSTITEPNKPQTQKKKEQ